MMDQVTGRFQGKLNKHQVQKKKKKEEEEEEEEEVQFVEHNGHHIKTIQFFHFTFCAYKQVLHL
jgi:hypothetical protein